MTPSGRGVCRWHGGGWVAAEHHGYSSIQCEPLALLGGEQCTAAGLARAVRVVDAVSVVLLTEQLSSSGLALLRHSLGLPASAFGEPSLRLINCFKPVVGAATREALQDHPAVRLDTALYEHARRRYQALLEGADLANIQLLPAVDAHAAGDALTNVDDVHVKCAASPPPSAPPPRLRSSLHPSLPPTLSLAL